MIQVGQVLDKYELLERVGHGGMAIVYRGLDRALKRVVAVKVLHKHLSDYQEARDRFEREAQAVAKLRHENILEIFDYSGAEAAAAFGSSYIVTEFVDGQTLKQLVTDRPIACPELGAMLMLQVCRALGHAHSVGILHRDVKPENIMIRADGVVKLMDFGISHMVDLERLTVTGQLLGSPAYMSPEHVEGRPIDFRTDVFAAGIVLYQLTVGKLPFEGKNPHEVLKRIAECKFVDPRQANARIGNRLGRIILRAMAGEPSARFPSVTEMVIALEGYLEESGIDPAKVSSELARYFEGPAAYERALEDRLVDHLTRQGQKLLAGDDRAGALDVFDRVLTIDPDNEKVIAILEGINRRARWKAGAVAALFVAALATGAVMIHRRAESQPLDLQAMIARTAAPEPIAAAPPAPVDAAIETDAAPSTGRAPPPARTDPAPGESGEPGARASKAGVPASGSAEPAEPPPAPAATAELRVLVSPRQGSEVRFGNGEWIAVPDSGTVARAVERPAVVTVRNPCCEIQSTEVRAGQFDLTVELPQKPGWIIARCDRPGVDVQIDGKPAELGKRANVFFDASTLEQRTITVVFVGDKVETRQVVVRSGHGEEVVCAP